jgi:minor extracellular serine protease Vpr
MRRRVLAVVFAALLVFVLVIAGGALAGKPPKGGGAAPPNRDFTEAPSTPTQSEYYTVVFQDPAAASYTGGLSGLPRTKPEPGHKLNPNSAAVRKYKQHLNGVHDNFRGWLSSRAPEAEVVREHFLTGNTLVYKLNGADPGLLAQGPGVKKAAPSALYRPAMTVSVGLINAPTVWAATGGQANSGSGIDVGVIDTGIDDTHFFFDCKGDIQHKVYASGVAGGGPDIVFDHGTHVAGTVAGCVSTLPAGDPVGGTISGVAPGAALYDYNIFPGFGGGFIAFGGSAFSHDIVEALEDTVEDGMDVLNMSIGGKVQGPNDLLQEAVDATADAGLVVAVAAGNSGPGDSTVESPGTAAGALTAGASTNPHFVGIPANGTKTGGGAFAFGAALGDFDGSGAPEPDGREAFVPAITAAYTTTSPANGCTAISTALAGKIAVIDRGVCTFATKIRNAQAAGAVGVLVVNNVAGDPTGMAHDGLAFPTIPAAMLGKNEGNSIKPSGNVTVDGSNPQEFITANADIIAGFSSRGPTPFEYLIKPDATAPGVNVYSSVFDNQFAFFQGTSMATPHLAGSAAVLLDAHPGWSNKDVKSAIVNTAKRPVTDHVNGTAATGALTRGGGRVDLAAATRTPLTLDPVSVSFGKWTGNKSIQSSVTVTVKNVSATSQLCGVSLTGPTATARVSVSPSSTSIVSGGTTTVTVSINAGRSLAPGDYEGDLVLTCGGTTLRAPWWVRVA